MLVKLFILGVFALAIFYLGYNAGSYQPSIAQAINVVGGQITTTDKENAIFQVFKTDVETVETTATESISKLSGGDKTDGALIAKQSTIDLQFLLNKHQSLQIIQDENPCPSLAEWEAAGGVPGGNEPNPPEFPLCDPDVLYDPARCTLFWEDLDDKVNHPIQDNPFDSLTARNVIVEVEWDGTIYNLALRDPSPNPANYPNNC